MTIPKDVKKISKHQRYNDFAKIFFPQTVFYCLLTLNWRAISKGNLLHMIVSDLLVGTVYYVIVKDLALTERSVEQWLGYITGGSLGSVLGLLIDNYWR